MTFRAPVRADPRIALDAAHRGYGCRLRCGTFTTTIEERAQHEQLGHAEPLDAGARVVVEKHA